MSFLKLKNTLSFLILCVSASLLFATPKSEGIQATILVTNLNDSGVGSLRAAINTANGDPGSIIQFNIGTSAPWQIDLITALPQITAAGTVIDATTQAGWSSTDKIILNNGASIPTGINIGAGAVEIYGLEIRGFNTYGILVGAENATIGASAKGNTISGNGVGIRHSAGNNLTIKGNIIGLESDGTTPLANGDHGIGIYGIGSTGHNIGGTAPGERNIISSNSGHGIYTRGQITVLNNYIGTDLSGSVGRANTDGGIFISMGTGNAVGNGSSDGRNVIIGGVTTDVTATINHNYLGTDFTGTQKLSTSGSGVFVRSGAGTTISNNVIVSDGSIILLDDRAIITNNKCGTDVTGTSGLGTPYVGIYVRGGGNNTISGNTFAYIDGAALDLASGTGTDLSQNSFFCNNQGMTRDGGINGNQPAPIINLASTLGKVAGTCSGCAEGDVIEVYRDNSGCLPYQAQEYLGSTTVSGGNWSMNELSLSEGDVLLVNSTNTSNGSSIFSNHSLVQVPDPFITTWITSDGSITIPINPGDYTYNYNIIWTNLTNTGVGDGALENVSSSQVISGLENGSTYQVEIVGDFPAIYFNSSAIDGPKLRTVEQWGDISWNTFSNAFMGCTNMNVTAADVPNLTATTSLSRAFGNCTVFNQSLNNWDVSSVVDFEGMFAGAEAFNQNLSSWDMSSAVSINSMFSGAINFNQNLSTWDVSGVSDMSNAFYQANTFDQDLGDWDMSSVTDATDMLSYSGLNTLNYNRTLVGWSNQTLIDQVAFGATDLTYSPGATFARDSLTIKFLWSINGDILGTDDFALEFASGNTVNFDNGLQNSWADYTIEFWLKSTHTSGQFNIFTQSDTNGGGQPQTIIVALLNGRPYYFTRVTNSGATPFLTGNTPVSDGNWHHMAYIRSGDTMQIFVDGILDVSGTAAIQSIEFPVSGLQTLMAGGSTVDNFRLWSYAKTDFTDRADRLNGDEQNLIAYYDMDDGAGSILTDKTINENHGNLSGFTFTSGSNWIESGPFPPVITVNKDSTSIRRPEITGTINQNNATILVTIDAVEYVASNNGDGTWAVPSGTISNLADGFHDVIVQATNPETSLTATDLSTDEIYIDATAPTVTVNTLFTTNLSPALNGTVNDIEAILSVTLNGETFAATNNGDSTWTIAGNIFSTLAEGSYDVEITATDPLGNVGNDSTTDELTIDLHAPQVTIDHSLANSSSPEITGTTDDPFATITVSIDGQTFLAINNENNTWRLPAGTLNDLSDGVYDIAVTATDRAGNEGMDNSSDELVIDSTVPIVAIDFLSTTNLSPTLSGTIDDTGAILQITLNDQTFSAIINDDGTWLVEAGTFSDLSEGVYDIVTTATDSAGNVATDETTNELIIDLTGPIITIDSLVINSPSPRLSGTIEETTATISVDLNGQSYSAVNNGDGTWSLDSGTVETLPDGVFDVVATGTDLLGNTLQDTTINELIIDLTAPDVTLDPLVTASISPTLTGTIDDIHATLTVTIEGIAYDATVSLDSSWSISEGTIASLEPMTYSAILRAEDTLGNTNTLTVQEAIIILSPAAPIVQDSLALITIYDSLAGDSWTEVTNWKSGLSISNWDGVTLNLVNDEIRVTKVNLSSNNVIGNFPIISRGLEALDSLDLSGNGLQGLPDLGGFSSLLFLNVAENSLEFDDLEPNIFVSNFLYSGQSIVGTSTEQFLSVGSTYEMSFDIGGELNNYQWMFVESGDTVAVGGQTSSSLTLENLTIDQNGHYFLIASNPILPELNIMSASQRITVTGNITISVINSKNEPTESGNARALKIREKGAPYDTLSTIEVQSGLFVFENLPLGDYLIVVDPESGEYLPTYFGNTDSWSEADTLQFRLNLETSIRLIDVPEGPQPTPGSTTVMGIVESDFISESNNGRVKARRKVKRAGCSVRRFVPKGRTDQEEGEFVLYAYVQSDDDGRFEFTNLENGTYRFNIDYPGIPMDPDSFIEFTLGPGGIEDDVLLLQALITENGIFVERIEQLSSGEMKDEFEVFPNPTSDWLNIDFSKSNLKDVTIQLMDLVGNVLDQIQIDVMKSKDFKIPVDDLTEGVYLLKVNSKKDTNYRATYKIIVSH
ncbi:BspA family leucine-rich repeat surface protein [Marinoscillum pacificum]|uniref:BspA family leucine-rich repeat surface protein n=1 Tax=Marinoscillum pacificum TaxID=392723 RepID=UPI00215791D9|nr:BspA family leucine-rich repeat surface protein [Marinoscillum pacificum]